VIIYNQLLIKQGPTATAAVALAGFLIADGVESDQSALTDPWEVPGRVLGGPKKDPIS
jgi:hypothetical protein